MAIDHPHDALPPGYRLGSYEILRVLGRGGFGITYQARRAGVAGDMVAIKELFPSGLVYRTASLEVVSLPGNDEASISDSIEMFLREAELICRLDHPNIVHGVESFHKNGTGYLVMRYISGKNLKESLRDKSGFKPSPKTLPIFMSQMMGALEALHHHGLLHCDIKPENIFLGVGYEPILIDLGSACRHVPGVGTEDSSTYSHYFSAIEQVADQFGSIGPWTDIYQFSAVLYRCITGGKLPDAMDRFQATADPYLPLFEIPESAVYPKALTAGIDHGLRLLPKHRPNCVTQWRHAMALPSPAKRKNIPSPPQPRSHGPLAPNRLDPFLVINSASEHSGSGKSSPPDFMLWAAAGVLILIISIVFLMIID